MKLKNIFWNLYRRCPLLTVTSNGTIAFGKTVAFSASAESVATVGGVISAGATAQNVVYSSSFNNNNYSNKNISQSSNNASSGSSKTSQGGSSDGGNGEINSELGSVTGYRFKEGIDTDFRGTGKSYKDALNKAFDNIGLNKSDFEVTKWSKDANGKSFPVEWRAKNGAEVSIDIGHTTNGPDVPHVGYQTGGKRGGGGAVRGHILVDNVPINR